MTGDDPWKELQAEVTPLDARPRLIEERLDFREMRRRLRANLAGKAWEPMPQLPKGEEPPRRAPGAEAAIEARLDLHGLPEAEAHRQLIAFIAEGRAYGCRTLLVITGKGLDPGGVLRRNVPRWMEVPPLSEHVANWKPADAKRGGEGALVVTLRRPSEGAPHG